MTRSIKTVAATGLVIGALAAGVAQADMESARQALSNNDFSSAVAELDQVLANAPDNTEALFLKGLALARAGDTDAALDVFNQLVDTAPNMAEAWNNLGVLRARNNDLPGAQSALEQAVELNPQHGPAQENLGDIYVAMAQSAYARAGELETSNDIARAKSQQLAEFIGGGTAGGGTSTGSRSTPPAVPNVTRNTAAQVEIDNSTPQAALDSWASAWSGQSVEPYLSMYASQFEPDDRMSRSAWAAQRRDRLTSPAYIDIQISNADIQRRGEQARVEFTQRYESNTYQDEERKALLMTETASGWQILREGSAQDVQFTAAATQTASVDSEIVSGDAGSGAGSATDDTSSTGSGSNPTSAGSPMAVSTPPASGRGTGQPASSSAASENNVNSASAPAQMQAESRQQARSAVESAVTSWAEAWSSQNVQRYLNAYSDNYRPQGDTSLANWASGRRNALNSPAWIRIDISDLQVSILGDDRAQVSFNQHYESNTYEDRERKRMTLVREDGGWRIIRES